CEPDPALDMGWFTAPATRSMLMHTKVFGNYFGKEEVVSKNPSYTEINVTENYAPVKKITVNVVDNEGKAVENAVVDFKIYNYAELYTVASKTTDSLGKATITLGLGDVVAWASKGDKFGFDKLSVKSSDSLTVKLGRTVGENIDVEFDIVPPSEGTGTAVEVTAEQTAENATRLKAEDAIRNQYIGTFMTSKEANDLAVKLNADTTLIQNLIKSSRGNHKNITEFLTSVSAENLPLALQLLQAISSKDLRDISSDVLTDHLNGTLPYKENYEGNDLTRYLLNPRVSSEAVTAYRQKFDTLVKGKSIEEIIAIAKGIKVADDQNMAVAIVKPEDVMALGVADTHSRDIFFVALARSAGYAARLDESSRKVQYSDGHSWIDVNFQTAPSIAPRGELVVDYKPTSTIPDPRYSTHFTFAKLNGTKASTISMPSNANYDMGSGNSSKTLFSKPLEMDEGDYIAVTGTRMASGEVLAKIKSFKIEKSTQNHLQLTLRENNEDLFVIGSINPEARITIASSGKESSILNITGRGYFILALIKPNAEPTNHSLRALKSLTSEIKSWGRPVIVALQNEDAWKSYKPLEFGELPVKEY
ncbi:MAG: Ig-like domain-containing protein, partial [Rikenellaceae bacterium]